MVDQWHDIIPTSLYKPGQIHHHGLLPEKKHQCCCWCFALWMCELVVMHHWSVTGCDLGDNVTPTYTAWVNTMWTHSRWNRFHLVQKRKQSDTTSASVWPHVLEEMVHIIHLVQLTGGWKGTKGQMYVGGLRQQTGFNMVENNSGIVV